MSNSIKPNTTGLIFAMREEQEGLQSFIQNKKVHHIAKRDFIQGELWGHPVVMVLSGIGKVAAASTTSLLIHHFQVNQLILSGVAGSTDPVLKVGDIVIGKELLQHDIDASPLFPRFEIPLTGKSRFFAQKDLLNEVQNATTRFIQSMKQHFSSAQLDEFQLQNVKLHTGLIASGDQFIHDSSVLNQLKQALPDLLAVEMEGAAIAQVCEEHDLAFVIIRTISDSANETAHIDFLSFVKNVAAPYSLGILKNYFENRIKS
ncbi:5'-methylthioadenosine/adenosylhomocysteine nucleosidase [Undibacterium sp. Di24W]|uniref:5'-methylthioadenosine/adenosylhomocysteine nucleosidase n=1 Tax=Undibacterium sp. Di24W TaxID=3413033 RepID=UPI003BF24C68